MQNADGVWWRVAFCLQIALFILHYADPASAQSLIGSPIVEVVIEQEGQPVADPLVRGLIETTVGEPLSMRDVRETTEHLYNLRRFDDIQSLAEAVPGGVRLTYRLFPSHPVDRVEFRGTLGLSERDLRSIITNRFGRAPAAGRAAEAAAELRRIYRDRGYPNARVETRIEETHDPDRATLIFDIDAGRPARIAAVQVIQVDEAEVDTLIGAPDIPIGQVYDREQVEQRLREWEDRLKALGYYEARASHGADIADDAYLRVNIARGPRVVVEFAGDPLPERERERLVPVRSEGSADEDLLEDAKLAIEEYLHGQGYRDAVATYTREETPGELTITFTIDRGPRYTVDAVRVSGHAAMAEEEIRELLRIERGDPFVRSALRARAAAIENLYRARGYNQARVEAVEAVLPSGGPAARRVEIAVAIEEGPRTFVRAVDFEGHTVFTESELRALALPTPGGVYSQAEVVASRERIELEYLNRGYENVSVASRVTPTENGTQADVHYTIVEGSQTLIDHVIVVGNRRTSTETITDELLFREGDPLGYSALVNSRARLAALGLFRRVDIQALQRTAEGRRDVLVQVEEADPTTLGYGGGIEATLRARPTGPAGVAEEQFEIAPRGFFEIGRRNLWGKNRAVTLFTRVSLRSTDILVDPSGMPLDERRTETNPGFNEYRVVGTFREPRLFDSGAELLVTGIVEQAIRTTFNFSRRIVRAESGLRLSPAFAVTGGYSFERTKLFDEIFAAEEKPVLIDRYFPEVQISKIAASLIRDTRDEPLDASRGTFLIVDGDVAARAMGSEVGFVKLFAQASAYVRLPGALRTVLAISGRIGAARGFAREVPGVDETVEDLPASERFFAGGDTSVRGFSLDRLGTAATISPTGFPLGGNGLVVLNSELRVNVLGPWQAVAFLDAGNVFRRAGDLDLTDLRPAAGIGIRYQSFGTIRLDWGFNLDRRDVVPGTRERGSVFHVSLGQAF